MTAGRRWIAAVGLVTALAGCGDTNDPYHLGPIAAGVVRLDATLSDANGNPTGTRRITTANDIKVWLLEGGVRTDSTLTFDGAYSFFLKSGHTYRTLVGLPPALTDSTPDYSPVGSPPFMFDTLMIAAQDGISSGPNPFVNLVHLTFQLAASVHWSLNIVNTAGAHVRTLGDRTDPAGTYTVDWNGFDDGGLPTPPGLYWAVLTTPGGSGAILLIKQLGGPVPPARARGWPGRDGTPGTG